ncbi:nuclear transport factor 2 family protein [Nonomuraea typhae]|uniref:nuclear transport factor 2 family protein n=1 Tax=Nonomuraea typhae TaxID=2603600 RepID=UPI0012FC7610|nr:nuclear transport factor 2 family protein [Nonomuraea typhae]
MIRELFDRQLTAIAEGDLETLLSQYHEDALVVRLDRVAKGTAEIRAFFTGYLELKPRVEEIKAVQVVDDTIFYNAVMTIAGNRVSAYGTLVTRDDRIWRQTASAVPLPSS